MAKGRRSTTRTVSTSTKGGAKGGPAKSNRQRIPRSTTRGTDGKFRKR